MRVKNRMMWASPDITADRLLYNVLWSGWIVVGAMLEERDLAALFGQTYRGYQSRVPMLIPTHIRPVDINQDGRSFMEAQLEKWRFRERQETFSELHKSSLV